MPSIVTPATTNGKRKIGKDVREREGRTKLRKATTSRKEDPQAQILLLETEILESRKHYNNIVTLISTAKQCDAQDGRNTLACVALCRVFCRLMAAGNMVNSKGMPENEAVIVRWLRERYSEYVETLLALLRSKDTTEQSTALTLIMRLVKQEAVGHQAGNGHMWRTGLFASLVRTILDCSEASSLREEFVEKFVEEYDDIRYHAFEITAAVLGESQSLETKQLITRSALALLSSFEGIPESKDDLENFYTEAPENPKHYLYSFTAHKKQAQDAWLALLRRNLTKEERKTVLGIMSRRVAPWFLRAEMLMNFLTDSYEMGGATSLLALSGLFYLIQEKNLDYPQFYTKLYSLLDDSLLHSKHRSRFFRLLETFMSSTHLPAALVASFMKKLSRLALHGPPGGIIVVVPWLYNMLKTHPTCTFMIHREVRDAKTKKRLEEEGMDDPFDDEEKDPMHTNALESSLWEIETLQSHYHPNVATLAKIISEQFTKRNYNLEDFLDHSYSGIVDAELGKELRKAPVVEYEIPKRIFSNEEGGLGPLGALMAKVMEANGTRNSPHEA
ncbi:CBF/Mak21 family-domain-containing protein [Cryomyces antarcticus]